MAGQVDWKDAGSEVNAHIVKEEIVASIEARATAASVFGKLNAGRVADTKIVAGGGQTTIGSGKESPIHEKTLNQNNTAIFTMEEDLSGMPTYGDAAVKPGDYPTYLHAEIQARRVRSPAFPIPGYEIRDNAKRVIPLDDHVARRKAGIAFWMNREFDLDGFRALLYGLSRGLYMDTDGGKGTELYGTTNATRWRAPWNTYVDGQGITSQAIDATAHNDLLGSAISSLHAGDEFNFSTHEAITKLIDKYRLRPVRLNGSQFRAVVLTDPRNMYSLRKDPGLVKLWAGATPRAEKNLALFSRSYIELDDVLYLPCEILGWFRPVFTEPNGTHIARFGCGFDIDPRSPNFQELYGTESDITMSIVLGAGALRRGRRKMDMRFTEYDAPHETGKEIAVMWDDGWMRNEWYSKDTGPQRIYCDSSFTVFNYDEGQGGLV